MAGILDWLSGEPSLDPNQLAKFGVDPDTVKTMEAIRNQAQSAAIGPALVGGVLSALAGRRQGAGTRALIGAGRAYTSAEQRAEAEPLQLAKFSMAQRQAQLKLQEELQTMQVRKKQMENYDNLIKYRNAAMNNPTKVADPAIARPMLGGLLNSANPEVKAGAETLSHQLESGKLTWQQYDAFYKELNQMDRWSKSGYHITGFNDPAGRHVTQVYDRQGNPVGGPRVYNPPGSAGATPGLTPDGGYDWSQQPKGVETRVQQAYNQYVAEYWKNRGAAATVAAQKKGGLVPGGAVKAMGAPMTFADFLAHPRGQQAVAAAGGHPVAEYSKFHTPVGAVIAQLPPGEKVPAGNSKPFFWPEKGVWVQRRGNKYVRVDMPFEMGKTMGTTGPGFGGSPVDTPAAPAEGVNPGVSPDEGMNPMTSGDTTDSTDADEGVVGGES